MAKKKNTPKTIEEANATIVEAQKNFLSAIKEFKGVSEGEDAPVPVEGIVSEDLAITGKPAPVKSKVNTEFAQHDLPPAGEPNPRAALVPATATSGTTVTQVQKLADLTSVELDAYIKDRALRCQRHVAGFARRASELYLGLFEMEGRFAKRQGARTDLKELSAQTWTEYVEGSGANYDSYRKWRSRMNAATKQLGVVVTPDSKSGASGNENPADAAVKQAAELLASAKENLGKAAEGGNEVAKAHIAQYEKEYADAVAVAAKEQTDAATAKVKPSAETRVNKRLAAIVEIAERYIRVMERVVHTATPNDRQKKDIEKASEAWRKVLQDARTLSWAVKIFEGTGETTEETEEAA